AKFRTYKKEKSSMATSSPVRTVFLPGSVARVPFKESDVFFEELGRTKQLRETAFYARDFDATTKRTGAFESVPIDRYEHERFVNTAKKAVSACLKAVLEASFVLDTVPGRGPRGINTSNQGRGVG
ncbi:unnamed protein product, partial [Amoebophrya sp. A120]